MSATTLPAVAALVVAGGVVVLLAGLLIAALSFRWARRRVAANAHHVRELQEALAHFLAMLDRVPDGYFAWAPSGLETYSPTLLATLNAPAISTRGFRDLAHLIVPDDFAALERAAAELRASGKDFAAEVRARNGRILAVRGQMLQLGRTPPARVLWFTDVTLLRNGLNAAVARSTRADAERDTLRAMLDAAPFPAWHRNADLGLAWVNRAYASAMESDPATVVAQAIEFAPGAGPQVHSLASLAAQTGRPQTAERRFNVAGARRAFAITEAPLAGGGTAGFAIDVTARDEALIDLRRHADAEAQVMNQLASAIIVFGPDKRVRFANDAFARLWGLDDDWFASHPTHAEVLEALRESRRLPEQADWRAYKAAVLAAYGNVLAPEEEALHLPDGRTLRVITAPHPLGGLVFVYDDITDRIALERSRNTLAAVQRATLDHLFEGVAVFGADGCLKLFNPGYARIWNLDEDFLRAQPHVADVAEHCRDLFTRGGDWEGLRDRIVSRTLERAARMERMVRADGRTIEYASVPLPDGNTLYTYFDVTDGALLSAFPRTAGEGRVGDA